MEFLDQIKKRSRIIKALIIGSGGVGKSSMLKVVKSGDLLPELGQIYQRTLFMEIETIQLEENNGKFEMMFMDLAGQTDLPMHALIDFEKLSLGGADLIILMFANNNIQSLIHLQNWYGLIHSYYTSMNKKLPDIILIQNKCDLARDFDQDIVESMKGAVPEIISHHQVSLVSGEGIELLKQDLANMKYKFGD